LRKISDPIEAQRGNRPTESPHPPLGAELIRRLYERANAARWHVEPAGFERALAASVAKAFPGANPAAPDVERYARSLHLEDLALACGCAAGDDEAWQNFVLTYRPLLYRAADAIDPGGGAREAADSLYAELFGVSEKGAARGSLFTYFHGRSSLATWLRSVLAQRHVDRIRERRRLEPLPDEESSEAIAVPAAVVDPERDRLLVLMRTALLAAVARLASKDRLRLACYYAQQMTLARVGRLLGEHEATVSRRLARTRSALRESVEAHLVEQAHLSAAQVSAGFAAIADDPGPLDLSVLLASSADDIRGTPPPGSRKKSAVDRSTQEST
jgi:RNA polymerase sigma-70 factor, ECF subfamily